MNSPTQKFLVRSGALALLASALAVGLSAYAVDPSGKGSKSPQNMLSPSRSNVADPIHVDGAAEDPFASARKEPAAGRTYPVPPLEKVDLRMGQAGTVLLSELPRLNTLFDGKVASLNTHNDFVFYTIRPDLQDFVTKMVASANSPHVAFVAIEPSTGKILAMSGKSSSILHPELYAGFPAASLFKLVTSTAAVEQAGLSGNSIIGFRGGTYTLNQWNYAPGTGRDTRSMSLSEALGKSCNPVFSRVALKFLSQDVIRSYAQAFGFNTNLRFDMPLPPSSAQIPSEDFELGRTAAGFGAVKFSPLHAAAMMAGIANNGLMLRPVLIDSVVAQNGVVLYQQRPEEVTRLMTASTSRELLSMMEKTTTVGTSRRAFMVKNSPILSNIQVAAKTGTLRGENPEGINNWFVAAAPLEDPTIAIAVLVVHPLGNHLKASQLGRQFMQKYFNRPVSALQPAPVTYTRKSSSYKYKAKGSTKYKSYSSKKSKSPVIYSSSNKKTKKSK